MVIILGYFYFGQDQRLRDEAAVIRATDEATRWLLAGGWRNVLVEVNNETDVKAYDHDILKPARVHELIERVRQTERDGRRLLVGTSYGGGSLPKENVVRASDFLLLHGNGVQDPKRITEMVKQTRAVPGYRSMPIVFNEDDHENFDQPENNFAAALREHVSWGWFDYRRKGESWDEGYQSPPVKWGLSSERKRAFFKFCAEITGAGNSSATTTEPGGLKEIYQAAFALGAAKREKTLRLIRSLKAQKVPLDGVGIQGHWCLDKVPFKEIEEAIIALHAEGLQVAISELDLDVTPQSSNSDPFASGCPPEVLQRQADQYARLFRLFRAHANKIERVTFWGLHDGLSWLNYMPRRRTNHPLLWSRQLAPKPAFEAVWNEGKNSP